MASGAPTALAPLIDETTPLKKKPTLMEWAVNVGEVIRQTTAARKVKAMPHRQGTLLQRWVTGSIEQAWKVIIAAACFFCLGWVVVTTFSPEPVGLLLIKPDGQVALNTSGGLEQLEPDDADALICPRATVCVEEWYTLLLLGISRATAYVSPTAIELSAFAMPDWRHDDANVSLFHVTPISLSRTAQNAHLPSPRQC